MGHMAGDVVGAEGEAIREVEVAIRLIIRVCRDTHTPAAAAIEHGTQCAAHSLSVLAAVAVDGTTPAAGLICFSCHLAA